MQVYPFAVEAAREIALDIQANGDLPTITGTADADARVFFSYAGPFDPIVDKYTLTCRW